MQDRSDAGHEECTTGVMQDMRNAGRGMHDRSEAGHEEFTTGVTQDMRNA